MCRKSIKVPRIMIEDVCDILSKDKEANAKRHYLVNIRACNGAGKSSIPMSFMKDEGLTLICWEYTTPTGKLVQAPFATWFRNSGIVAFGTYFNATGGLDGFKNNAATKRALDLLWELPVDIIMEGVISSTVYSTYSNWFQEKQEQDTKDIVLLSLLPPIEVCLQRIQKRNGGKKIDEKAVSSKWRTVERNVIKFRNDGLNSVSVDNANVPFDSIQAWFLETVNEALNKWREK